MNKFASIAIIFTLLFITGGLVANANAAKRGTLSGGIAHSIPDWFKESFLDLSEDASEAAQNNKHVLLFMTLNGCPYCSKMLNEVFAQDKEYIQKHFDSIAINIKGDRMVTPPGGEEMTEKNYAGKLRVLFTPTIVFLDADAKPVYRINGFWNSKMFRAAIEYVSSKSYKTMSLPTYVKARAKQDKSRKPVYTFRSHPQLKALSDFSKITKPLIVLFEDKRCQGCNKLHDRNLNRPEIKKELKSFVFTRLDADSQKAIIDINGKKTTAKDWADSLKVSSRPGLVLFDEGKEQQRITGELYGFHFKYALSYVSGKHYKTYDGWLKYLNAQQEKILQSGGNIDIGDLPVAAGR